ncbi:MAG: DUF3995 domain-containing protein [Clostridia bacterium]|nr:DUF3995 domain-containing protein [Clostridia bacterium]
MRRKNDLLRGILQCPVFCYGKGNHGNFRGGRPWGGTWGFDAAIPTVGGKPEFNPPPAVPALVAVALGAAVLIIFGQLGLWGRGFPQWVFHWGVWGLVMFFILRSTLAFFHTENSLHAYWDVRFFSPLSFVMGLLCWVGLSV